MSVCPITVKTNCGSKYIIEYIFNNNFNNISQMIIYDCFY